MSSLKRLYHALVPPSIRYPIGAFRRRGGDRLRRFAGRGPLPPRRLLTRVQMTPWIREYLEVGERAAAALRGAFDAAALEAGTPDRGTPDRGTPDRGPRILDFGCGLGRVLRHFEDCGWHLEGCDVDPETVAWSRRAFPFARLAVSPAEPPLAYPEAAFDAVYAVSVFTHFDAGEQTRWAAELARVLRPGGLAVISTMGPRAFANFPQVATAARRQRLEQEGFVFLPGEEAPASTFNARGAFHTAGGIARFFAPGFELEAWIEGGLDGFQDLAVLRRTGSGS